MTRTAVDTTRGIAADATIGSTTGIMTDAMTDASTDLTTNPMVDITNAASVTEVMLSVTGMTCSACEAHVRRAIEKLDGVEFVVVSLMSHSAKVRFNPQDVSVDHIISAVTKAGYEAALPSQATAQSGARGARGAAVQGNGQIAAVTSARAGSPTADDPFLAEAAKLKQRLTISVPLLLVLMYVSMGTMMGLPALPFFEGAAGAANFVLFQAVLTSVILLINRAYFLRGIPALFRGAANMDTLVALGSLAAYGYGAVLLVALNRAIALGNHEFIHHVLHNLYFESAAMIVVLISIGKYLECRSKAKTSTTLKALLALRPQHARVIRDGVEVLIALDQVAVGDQIKVLPGETMPVDGVVVSGASSCDESSVTGESVPVFKEPGSAVISGTMNQAGSLIFEATKVGEDSTINQIIALVQDANATKAPLQSLADKIAGIFVPAVLVIAALTVGGWLIAGASLEFALELGISVLVISCPCALGLATPVAIMVATGKGAQEGILFKSAQALEDMSKVKAILFDKTGTITKGSPEVVEVACDTLSEHELVRLTASLEAHSEQPLARAVLAFAKERKVALAEVRIFEAIPGKGVAGVVDGHQVLVGSEAFCREQGVALDEALVKSAHQAAVQGNSLIFVACDGKLVGWIGCSDAMKPESPAALERLSREGITTVLVSGDNQTAVEAIVRELRLDEIHAQILPADKERIVREVKQAHGGVVAMVGDGVNDAPALARADVGIAIGAGSDVAVESADIVLMRSSLKEVVVALRLSRATVKNIKQNLFWAFFYNVACIPLAAGLWYPAFGLTLNPMIAAAAMSLSSVFVVSNALRLQRKSFGIAESTNATQTNCTLTNQEIIEFDGVELEKEKGSQMAEKVYVTLTVDGMMCQHCQKRVHDALVATAETEDVTVNLEEKTARVLLPSEGFDAAELAKAVEDAGYTVEKVDCDE